MKGYSEIVERNVILGIDILPSESAVKPSVKYAATLLVDGKVEKRFKKISREKLLKLIDRFGVDILAVDNIYEIGENSSEIAAFMSKPIHTPRLVQVNVIHGKEYNLEHIARSLGLFEGGKLNPLNASEIIAKLAYMKIGSEAVIFENETRITVSRGRSLTQGGMSKERYRRNIDSLIFRITNEIKDTLNRNKIEYDLYFRKSPYGYSGSIFIVYAPRNSLYGLVKPMKGHDVHVSIEPIVREAIEFIPLRRKRRIYRSRKDRYLIVGVDPGISTGLAILTIDGYLLHLMSRRWLSRNQIIRILSEWGKPLIVATDSNPPPTFAKKLATSLNALLYVPKQNLSVKEKREIVSRFIENLKLQPGIKVYDSHQRDALAAALKAYFAIENKMRQVETVAKNLAINLPISEIKALVIKGYTVKDAVKIVASSRIPVQEEVVLQPQEKDYKAKISYLEALLEQKEKIIKEYELQLDFLDKEIAELRGKISELENTLELLLSARGKSVKTDRKVKSLENRAKFLAEKLKEKEVLIDELQSRIYQWRKITELALDEKIEKLIVIKVLSLSGVSEVLGKFTSLDGKIVYVLDATPGDIKAAGELIKENVKALIVKGFIPEYIRDYLERSLIPVIKDEEIEIIGVDGEYFAMKDSVTTAIKKRKRLLDEKWLHSFTEELDKIIENYRFERRKQSKKLYTDKDLV